MGTISHRIIDSVVIKCSWEASDTYSILAFYHFIDMYKDAIVHKHFIWMKVVNSSLVADWRTNFTKYLPNIQLVGAYPILLPHSVAFFVQLKTL